MSGICQPSSSQAEQAGSPPASSKGGKRDNRGNQQKDGENDYINNSPLMVKTR